MKNIKKLVALFAATAMTMSLSLSAFAATVDTTVEGDGDVSSSFNLVFDVPEGATDADVDQLTMIAYLVDADTDPEEIPDYSSQTIVAINQVDGEAGFGLVPVDVEKLEEGYAIAVAMGGTDVGEVAKYLVTYDEETGNVVVYGDVNGDGVINTVDAGWVLSKYANTNLVFPCQNDEAGDVNGDDVINTVDAGWILSKYANTNLVFPAEQQ